MNRLTEAYLCLQPDKYEFPKREVSYLGHIIGEGVKPDPRKIVVVKQFLASKTVQNVKQFLGLCGYYQRLIKDFSKIVRPSFHLTKKDYKFENIRKSTRRSRYLYPSYNILISPKHSTSLQTHRVLL